MCGDVVCVEGGVCEGRCVWRCGGVEGDVWMCEGGVCDGKNLVICHADDVM